MAGKISGVPTSKQQKFILTELIPAILQEGGERFAMDSWRATYRSIRAAFESDGVVEFDGLVRFEELPKVCHSVQCVGGTAETLLFGTRRYNSHDSTKRDEAIAKKLGLTYREAYGLFYHWQARHAGNAYCWPENFREAFYEASSALEKAQVVAALLTKIATEGGKCLHNQ